MSATEYRFRGAALGGFNRQDVLNYVESIFAEHNEQLWDLKNQLQQAQETCARQAEALAEAEADVARREEENARLSAELAEARTIIAEQTRELTETRMETEELRQKVAELEPGADAYARIKDRAASLEMEAHMRAQAILDETAAQARASREQTERWLRGVQETYDRLRTDLDATVFHTSGELGRIQNALAGLAEAFALHDDSLHALEKECRNRT